MLAGISLHDSTIELLFCVGSNWTPNWRRSVVFCKNSSWVSLKSSGSPFGQRRIWANRNLQFCARNVRKIKHLFRSIKCKMNYWIFGFDNILNFGWAILNWYIIRIFKTDSKDVSEIDVSERCQWNYRCFRKKDFWCSLLGFKIHLN